METREITNFVVVKKPRTKVENEQSIEERIVFSSENDILVNLDRILIKTLHDVGLDEYLLKTQAFNREKYFNAITTYEELFNSGKVATKEHLKKAFQYVTYFFKNEVEMLDGSNDILKNMYDYYMSVKDEINTEEYQYIRQFMSYVEENEFGQQMVLR